MQELPPSLTACKGTCPPPGCKVGQGDHGSSTCPSAFAMPGFFVGWERDAKPPHAGEGIGDGARRGLEGISVLSFSGVTLLRFLPRWDAALALCCGCSVGSRSVGLCW